MVGWGSFDVMVVWCWSYVGFKFYHAISQYCSLFCNGKTIYEI